MPVNIFYVYRHIRLDSNTPFYVGKGSKNRAYNKRYRNAYWMNIVRTIGYRVELMLTSLSEEDAYKKEAEFIRLYKKFGYCEANLCEGGKGGLTNPSDIVRKKISDSKKGKKRSEESIRKQCERMKGSNNPNFGKKHSAEVRLKMSKALSVERPYRRGETLSKEHKLKISKCNSKKVIDIYSGIIYDSVIEAANCVNVKVTYIYRHSVKKKNKTRFRYLKGLI